MPVKITYTEDGLGIIAFALGIVTGKELIEANDKVGRNKNFSKLKYKIADRSECVEYNVESSDMKIIAEGEREAAKLNPDIIVALIASSEVQIGMSRMYQSLMADIGFESNIFEDRESADKWITSKLEKQNISD